ncbi:MAG: hypothetical protein Fur0041_02160 [Bacteroidia bacterium]
MHGQDFINGSFEDNGKLCLINASTNVFNANVRHTRSFGSFRKPDIASDDCGFGAAKDGHWFVGLATNIQGDVRSEAITLELTSPVVAGAQYSISFWARSRSYAPNIELGISGSDSLAGSIFYTVSAEKIGSEWSEVNVRFTAPVSGKFISVRASNNNVNSGVWLDAFRLSKVFSTDNAVVVLRPKNTEPVSKQEEPVVTKIAKAQPEIYPNPSEGVFRVNAENADILSMTVFNTLGTTVSHHIVTPDQPLPDKIDLSDQQPGMYFVELATLNGKITKRIIVSR